MLVTAMPVHRVWCALCCPDRRRLGRPSVSAVSELTAFNGRNPGQRWLHIDVSTLTAENAAPEMTAADRCDACGAQAYVRVLMAGGGELLFCAHHARKHSEALSSVATHIHDETERLHADNQNER